MLCGSDPLVSAFTGPGSELHHGEGETHVLHVLSPQAQLAVERVAAKGQVYFGGQRVLQGMFLERVGNSPPYFDQTGKALCRRVELLETEWWQGEA